MEAARIRVRGDHVAAALARAGALELRGWARIAEDDAGVTAVHVEGEPEAVAALAASLGEGVVVERVRPEGHEQLARRGVPAGRFTVTGDDAEGYALALEVGGAPRVWRLRKAPSMVPAEKRGATIPRGDAGWPEGAVWDAGDYEQGGRVPWPEAIDRGHTVFVLRGERLRGGFALQRTRPPLWLLIKRRDAYAAPASAPTPR